MVWRRNAPSLPLIVVCHVDSFQLQSHTVLADVAETVCELPGSSTNFGSPTSSTVTTVSRGYVSAQRSRVVFSICAHVGTTLPPIFCAAGAAGAFVCWADAMEATTSAATTVRLIEPSV